MITFKKTQNEKTNPLGSSLGSQLIRLHPSGYGLTLVFIIHACAVTAILISNIPIWAIIFSVAALFISLGCYYQAWQNLPVYRLQKLQDDSWLMVDEAQKECFLSIESCYYWAAFLVILKVKNNKGKIRYYPIFADSCGADEFRNLRVIAKYFI